MEKVAFELYNHLSALIDVKMVKYGGSNKWLPIVIPYLLIRAIGILLTKPVDVIYLEDGLLSPLGIILRIFRKPLVVTIHGLDITYINWLYQFVVPKCVGRLDRVVCISDATKKACLDRGIPERKVTVIPDGISDELYIHVNRQNLKEKLSKITQINLKDKKILLSVGRLVERKGIHWFVENVMSQIIKKRNDCIHLVVGDGSFSPQIQEIIDRDSLNDSVHMLGRIDEETLKLLYNASDLFIMPNIPVKGDMEGFGIVTLEASSCALPVIASNIEGIKDAIQNDKNGFLVEPKDAEGFIQTIEDLLRNDDFLKSFGQQAREFSLETYGWEKVAQKYQDEFEKLGR
ncbi:MAG: glycosyltransferase family 4 protein [Dehalococcoidia bacterium]|nr:MAG: glycosyltransferase family 4 protein [Dehalococcoidia bacterium]